MTKRDRATDLRMRRNYGLTLAEYTKVLKFQNNACAICKRGVAEFKNRLAIEHRHSDGLLRGLCCWTCNKTLAVSLDDAERLRNAASYLDRPPITTVFGLERWTAPGRVGTKKRAKLLKALAAQI